MVGPISGSLHEGSDDLGSLLGAPDFWKLPYLSYILAKGPMPRGFQKPIFVGSLCLCGLFGP